MKELNQYLKKVEKVSKEDLFVLIQSKSLEIIPALQALTGKNADSVMVYCIYLHGILALDGRLADEEYASVLPLCKAMFGDDFDYAACRDKVKNMSDDDQLFAKMVEIVKALPEEIASDIVLVTIAICAIDGKVSKPERKFIEKLMF